MQERQIPMPEPLPKRFVKPQHDLDDVSHPQPAPSRPLFRKLRGELHGVRQIGRLLQDAQRQCDDGAVQRLKLAITIAQMPVLNLVRGEAGAEFVHGEPPETWSIIRAAGGAI